MLNKLGKKICAGVCALSLGFSLSIKSDAFVWDVDVVVALSELYTSFRIMQYRVVGSMLKMCKGQVEVKVEMNNIVNPVPKE